MGRVDGKVAFVTGAARGQGRSHAVELAREGADIIAVDICRQVEGVSYATASPEDLAETVRLVEALDRRIVAAHADVRDLGALQAAVDGGVAELGRLDIVVANTGIAGGAPTLDMDEATWQRVIDVNLTGQWKTVKAAVPHIIAGGRGGAVVITSSLAAMYANEHCAHYAASKAGLVMFAKVLAKELAPQSIRVNTIHPCAVDTPMIHNEALYGYFRPDLEKPTRADFEEVAVGLNLLPVPTIEAVDVTNAVLYLVSDDGRYVTGTTHVVDAGGQLI
jgi:SDR family mycofactocin-dependent oxidoreductase